MKIRRRQEEQAWRGSSIIVRPFSPVAVTPVEVVIPGETLVDCKPETYETSEERFYLP